MVRQLWVRDELLVVELLDVASAVRDRPRDASMSVVWQVWVRDVREAAELLDVASGQRVPKDQVFLLHYRRFGVVTDLGKAGHMFSAGGGAGGMAFPPGPPLVSPGIASPVSGA